MIAKIKEYFWVIVIGAAIIGIAIFLRDMDRIEELKALMRRKKVEDDVEQFKRVVREREQSIDLSEQQLTDLAEQHRVDRDRARNASDDDIYEYYREFFGKQSNNNNN